MVELTEQTKDGAAKVVFMIVVFIAATATRGDWLLFVVYLSKSRWQTLMNTSSLHEVVNATVSSGDVGLLETWNLQNLPLFLFLAVTSSFVMYYGIAYGFMWYFYINRRDKAHEWKCQPNKFLTPANERHEILLGSANMLFGSLVSGIIACYISNGGYSKMYYGLSDYGWSYLPFSAFAMFLYNDCLAYYLHRLFHYPFLYRHIHKVHHRYHQPTAFSAVAMHPAEFVLYQGYLAAIPFMVPIHPAVYVPVLLYTYYYGLMDHSGVKMNAFWPWQPPSQFHDNHHKYFHVNFGFNSYLFDWLHDTLDRPDREYAEDIFGGFGRPKATNKTKVQ
ncbi:uncharacterized protein LOC132548235 [Ylistrum balloti]|uniref:uncharacterized protein LOC132548235 n=1 Tax=Ylistrum balloti TaxID=509963 RepID=UPI002905CE16|nr:uncharacterized protein LOC132548235 [Ylistrum balloti]